MKKFSSLSALWLLMVTLFVFGPLLSCSNPVNEAADGSGDSTETAAYPEAEAPTYISVEPHSSEPLASINGSLMNRAAGPDNIGWNDIKVAWKGNMELKYAIQRRIDGGEWTTLHQGYVSGEEDRLYYLDNQTDYWWLAPGWNGLVYYKVGAIAEDGEIVFGEEVCFVLAPRSSTLRVSLSQANRAYKCDVYKMFGGNQGQMLMGDSMQLWETVNTVVLPAGSWVAFSIDVLTTFSQPGYPSGESYKLDSNSWQCQIVQIPQEDVADDAVIAWRFHYEDILLERPFCDHDYDDVVLTVELLEDNGGITETGSITGNVKNAITRGNLENVLVTLYNADNEAAAAVFTDSTGSYTLADIPVGTGYRCEYSLDQYLPSVYSNITVRTDIEEILETVYLQPDQSLLGTASGTIKNALDGSGVEAVALQIREGLNTQTGPVLADATTDSSGFYSVTNLPAGNYTASISKAGFISTSFTLTIIGGQDNPEQNSTITPELGGDEVRIVLTWGEEPVDLDSHITGPLENSTSRFHVYYGAKGSQTASPYAQLDVDDTTSFGPETITVYQMQSGVYRYMVHDYTNKSRNPSTYLASSGAKAVIYQGNAKIAEFNVPNQPGTIWTVFELEGSQVRPINTMDYEDTPSNVRNMSIFGAPSDLDLFRSLPQK